MASIFQSFRLRRIERSLMRKKKRIERMDLQPDAKQAAINQIERQLEIATEKYLNGTL